MLCDNGNRNRNRPKTDRSADTMTSAQGYNPNSKGPEKLVAV